MTSNDLDLEIAIRRSRFPDLDLDLDISIRRSRFPDLDLDLEIPLAGASAVRLDRKSGLIDDLGCPA